MDPNDQDITVDSLDDMLTLSYKKLNQTKRSTRRQAFEIERPLLKDILIYNLCDSVEEVKEHISRQNTPEPGTPPPARDEIPAEAAVDISSQGQQALVLKASEQDQGSSSSDTGQVVALDTADQDQRSGIQDTAEDVNNNDWWFDDFFNDPDEEDNKADEDNNLNAHLDAENHLPSASDYSQASSPSLSIISTAAIDNSLLAVQERNHAAPQAASFAASTSSANDDEVQDKQGSGSTNKENSTLNNASKILGDIKTAAEGSNEASKTSSGASNPKKRSAATMEDPEINQSSPSTSNDLPLPSEPRKKLRSNTTYQQSTISIVTNPKEPATYPVIIDKENVPCTKSLAGKRKRDYGYEDGEIDYDEEAKPRKFLRTNKRF